MDAAPTDFDVAMMRRAISLAMRGRGTTEPNPSVGCVIVKDGRILGEGHTEPFGGRHAEPVAISNCTESPAGATAYTTLEPCCHTNKKTPPCVPFVIAAGIKRVVVGCRDPNSDVNGKGLAQLRAAGIDVTAPLLEPECKQLIAPFIARVVLKRPYVTLKWAQSADGKIAGSLGRRVQISNPTSMRIMHALRGRSDAVMVGVKTVLNDDPLLTTRDPGAPRKPLRVVLDTHLHTPLTGQLAITARDWPTIIFCSEAVAAGASALREKGIEVVPTPPDKKGRPSLAAVFTDLHCRAVTHLMVEPGERLSRILVDNSLWDRAWVFRSPNPIPPDDNGAAAPSAVNLSVPPVVTLDLAGDVLAEYLNPSSPAFFAPVESADLAKARQSVQNGND
jgi:diaminohydroxyphosphoribosylaminopyrimidine deaminase/5-amino-6-(5-phosphoribosylamino)uracil reductase